MTPNISVVPNPVVGYRYGTAGLIFLALAMLLQGAGWFLLWPAVSSMMVSGSYLRWGSAIYRKKNGCISPFSAVLLAPTRLGQWLSLLYYRRKTTLYSEVVQRVLLGRQPTGAEAKILMDKGVTRVLDTTAEFSRPTPFKKITYLNLAIPDLTAPTQEQLQQGIDFIREGLEKGENTYVHCKVGYSRSGAVVGAALLRLGFCTTPQEAIHHLEKIRPGIILRPEARSALFQMYDQAHVEIGDKTKIST